MAHTRAQREPYLEHHTLQFKTQAAQERALTQKVTLTKGMVADSASMLRLTMPVHEDVIDCLYQHCIAKGLYDVEKHCWSDMPKSRTSHEESMYQPVQAIGQCIHAACQDGSPVKFKGKSLKLVQHGTSNMQTLNGVWNVFPNRAPRSMDSFAADIRPDVDFSINSKERIQLSAEIDTYIEVLKEV